MLQDKIKIFRSKLVLGFLSLIIVVSSGFILWSSFQKSEKSADFSSRTINAVSVKAEILNASFSAVPALHETVISQKQLTNITTSKGNDLLVLVNKGISLPADYIPADLVYLPNISTGGNARLRKEAADWLQKMFAAAKGSGWSLFVTSGYRSYAEQVQTFNYWVQTAGLAAANSFSARAGHSQHQLGTAADISAPSVGYQLSQDFGNKPEGKWLAENSWKYGFILSYPSGKEAVTGYSYEPWHFRYIGLSAAAQIHGLGWDLETFLEKYGVW